MKGCINVTNTTYLTWPLWSVRRKAVVVFAHCSLYLLLICMLSLVLWIPIIGTSFPWSAWALLVIQITIVFIFVMRREFQSASNQIQESTKVLRELMETHGKSEAEVIFLKISKEAIRFEY